MSLINEALKKAQRQRSDTPPGMMPTTGGFEPRGNQPRRTQSLILLIAGAAVLVVFSVVITVYLVNRTPAPVTAAPVIAATPTPPANLDAPSPVIVAPLITIPTPTEAAPVIEPAPVEDAAPEETVAAAPIAIPPITPAARQPELHIQLFVDAIRVMGIRSSGGESKVLMNDRVYRVNDIVDRTLALKLVKVDPEMLTFADPNGMIYTKSF